MPTIAERIAEPEDEAQLRIRRAFELDRMVRSHIIYEANSLDNEIERIISWHFCPDKTKHLWFQSLIFRDGQITFSNKIRIFKKLLHDCYPDIEKEVPGLTKKLESIRDIRNKFAHSEIVLDDDRLKEADDKGVFLRTLKDGKIVDEFFRKEEADKILGENNYFNLVMTIIWMEIQNRVQGKKEHSLVGTLKQMKEKIPDLFTKVKMGAVDN